MGVRIRECGEQKAVGAASDETAQVKTTDPIDRTRTKAEPAIDNAVELRRNDRSPTDAIASAHVGDRPPTGALASAHVGDRSPTDAIASAHVGDRSPDDAIASGRVGDRSPTDAIASAHVGATKLDMAILRTQAKAALVGLGWKPAIARVAIAAALAGCGNDVTLEQLIFESLRRCPMPKA